MSKRNSIERHLTAYHEAAHAVMAFRFGIPVEVVALCENKSLAGYVKLTTAPLILIKPKKRRSLNSWPVLVQDTERRAMIFLAGALAEAKLLGTMMRSYGAKSDLDRCLTICERLHFHGSQRSKAEGITMANRLREQTAQVLARPEVWRAIVAIAEDLNAWSQLTGPEAADTGKWSRRLKNQLSLLLPMSKARKRH